VTIDAAMGLVFNGTGNAVKYTRFANGKRPTITQNQGGNDVEKVAFLPGANKKAK
jgi:hypothetical protein